MIRLLAATAALGIAALCAAGSAQAGGTAVPAFSGSTECVSGGTVLDVFGPCSLGGGAAFFSPSPFALVQATAAGPASSISNGALAFLTFHYTIDGPDNGPIAVDIFSNLLTTADAPNVAFASLIDTEDHQLCTQVGQIGCNGVSQLNGKLVEMETPGVVYTIGLEVEASENGFFGGSAFASADPFIGIDPLDLNPDLYSIRLSDGVANGLPPSGAPEPAVWTLMILGLGAAGASLRARRVAAA
jgi:hypothetical protein